MKAISIMYHDVVERSQWDTSGFPGADAALYKLEREDFAKHLAAIAGSAQEKPASVLEVLANRREKSSFMLTFDDGGVSAYDRVAEMLETKGWRGHFFITSDYIGSSGFLSGDQIRELHQRGHIIGSHSSSHPQRMYRCTVEELLHEWQTSLDCLSQLVGKPVVTASVPGGYFSRKVARAASRAGIKALFTSEPTATCFEVDGCLVIGRYAVQRGMKPETAARLARGDIGPRLRQKLFWNAKKAAKLLGGEYYLKLRQSILGSK